jgi:thiamine biosynthesis protein ThiS
VTAVKAIFLNGKDAQTTADTVAALVAELGFPNRTVLVEHNGTALRPEEWLRPIAEGDRLELLRIVAGG